MASFLDDKSFIANNIDAFSKKMESQYTAFLEKTPTFTDYFSINTATSTVDRGLQNIEKLTGSLAPTRYNLIKDLPIYGIEQIIIGLSDEEEGLQGDYEGEGILLPNTIIPKPDDYFVISYLDKAYTFRVINVAYDTIKSNNFYKIDFVLKSVDISYYNNFLKAVDEEYKVIFRNIGTNEKFLIKSSDYDLLKNLDEAYQIIKNKYLNLFYVEKYNSLIFSKDSDMIYFDPYLNFFCNDTKLFARDWDDLYNIFLNDDYCIERFEPFYGDNTFFAMIVERDIEMVTDIYNYFDSVPMHLSSIFKYYSDHRVTKLILNQNPVNIYGASLSRYITEELTNGIINNKLTNDNSIYNIIIKYMNKATDDDIIREIKTFISKRIRIDYSFQHYILIPIFMYIIKGLIDTQLKPDEN